MPPSLPPSLPLLRHPGRCATPPLAPSVCKLPTARPKSPSQLRLPLGLLSSSMVLVTLATAGQSSVTPFLFPTSSSCAPQLPFGMLRSAMACRCQLGLTLMASLPLSFAPTVRASRLPSTTSSRSSTMRLLRALPLTASWWVASAREATWPLLPPCRPRCPWGGPSGSALGTLAGLLTSLPTSTARCQSSSATGRTIPSPRLSGAARRLST
mmetsp:Transcript_18355/g.46281  ORF Transcript_18355/g.46281 Transcript_18355/m.46281 type:complete len:211 (+) Transcript_18355:125-757(+)